MIRFILWAAVVVAPTVAGAQEWALRGEDRVLTRPEVITLIEGQTLVFYDDGASAFSQGGAYSYTYAGGGTAFGTFEVGVDGTVCIAYRNGFDRCDRYVSSKGRIVMLTQKGERFPVRPGVAE